MSFPTSPAVGDTFTNPSNNVTYQYTTKGLWKIVRATGSGGTVFTFKYTASTTAPSSPSLGDQWFDENLDVLKTWAYDGNSYNWLPISLGGSVNNNYESIADIALPLTWIYGNTNYAFELWSADQNYTWLNVDPTPVTSAIAGDDTLYLGSTINIKAGGSYVIYKEDGTFAQQVDILAVLNSTVVRLVNTLSVNIGVNDKVIFSRTSFAVKNGGAVVQNGDIYIGKHVSPVAPNSQGQLIIRRSAEGSGTFTVQYRLRGSTTFNNLDLNQTMAVGTDYRDEYYLIPVGGSMQFKVSYSGAGETIYYMVNLPQNQTVDANRVLQPVNVYPTDQTVNVSTTPTLLGSPFTSIYGLTQNGAEFRIASDKAFKNIVVSSSSDFLSSWTTISGLSGNVKGFVFYAGRKGVAVGDSALVKYTADGGNTYTAGTPVNGVTTDLKAVAFNGTDTIITVGTAGSIQYSTNFGQTFTAGNASDSFAGQLNGVAAFGNYAVAVGAAGEILRTINKGVIWNKVSPDNAYSGTFTDVACDANGNFIAVGANGEIQTSNDFGATWQHRSNAGNYTGTFNAVAFNNSGVAIAVGANAAIQYSSSYGASWSAKTADNSYSGTFYGVDINGTYAIVSGANGEIQSSKNGGLNWTHRVAANSATGTFYVANLTSDNYGLIQGSSGLAQKGIKLEGANTSYSVPSGTDLLSINKLYYWQCRYQDAAGFWSQWSTPTIFATSATINAVLQPSNLSPAGGATNIITQPTLQITKFGYVGTTDTQTASNYQIASDGAFTTIVYDSGDVTDFTSHTITSTTALTGGNTYYWRARQKGTINGYSTFSAPTSFTVANKSNKPVISAPTNNTSVYGDGLVVSVAAFNSPIVGDTLSQTTFQFDTTLQFTAPISATALNALTFTLPSNTLNTSTTYFMRAATKGTNSDFSSWSDTVTFNTRANPPTGEVIYVAAAPVTNNINGSNVTTPANGSFTFTVPDNVYDIWYVGIATGGTGGILECAYPAFGTNNGHCYAVSGGGGGGLVWGHMQVTPGQQIPITVGYTTPILTSVTPYVNNPVFDFSNGVNLIRYDYSGNYSRPGTDGSNTSIGTDGTALGGKGGVGIYNSGAPYNDGNTYTYAGGLGGGYTGGLGGGTGGQGGDLRRLASQVAYSVGNGDPFYYSIPGGGGAAGYTGNGGKGACYYAITSSYNTSAPPAQNGDGGGAAGGAASTPYFIRSGDYYHIQLLGYNNSGDANNFTAASGGGTAIYGQGLSGSITTSGIGGAGSVNIVANVNPGVYGGGRGAVYANGFLVYYRYYLGISDTYYTDADQNTRNQSGQTYPNGFVVSPAGYPFQFASGAVRIIWGKGRSFPNNAT